MTPLQALQDAKRPLLIYGWGIHLARAETAALELAAKLGVPYATTWGAADLESSLHIGSFGTHGERHVNRAIYSADWILCVGTRLDTKAVGQVEQWAPKASVWMVDIDQGELDKFKQFNHICEDAKQFLLKQIAISCPDFTEWHEEIIEWREDRVINRNNADPYYIMGRLSRLLDSDDIIVSDTGCTIAWFMQAFRFSGQRFYHALNNTPMGCGLPMAIGAAFASDRRVICITGDGGLGVSIGELAVVARHNLPIKILLFNNQGHGMCRQTQREWLGNDYPATSFAGGLATPNFRAIAQSFGIANHEMIEDALSENAAAFLEFAVNPDAEVIKTKYGRPNFE